MVLLVLFAFVKIVLHNVNQCIARIGCERQVASEFTHVASSPSSVKSGFSPDIIQPYSMRWQSFKLCMTFIGWAICYCATPAANAYGYRPDTHLQVIPGPLATGSESSGIIIHE
jgi:hypothetical protein